MSDPHVHHAPSMEEQMAALHLVTSFQSGGSVVRAQSASVLHSPMLRLLGQDSGSRHSLMRMLSVADLSSLLRSSRLWREWIASSPSVGDQPVHLHSRCQPSFLDCRWVQRAVRRLCFEGDGTYAREPWRFDQFVGSLYKLTRLRMLDLTLVSGFKNPPLLRQGLSSAAATLRHLKVTVAGTWIDVNSLSSAAAAIPLLESLEIHLRSVPSLHADASHALLNLSSLPSLTMLQRFSLTHDKSRVPTTPEHVLSLAQCPSLTDLCCGQWMLELSDCFSLPVLSPEQLDHIRCGIATLVRLRSANGAAPLRRLFLASSPVIVSENWQWLSQCTELESIDAGWNLDPAGWMKLAHFQRLHSLKINGTFDEQPTMPNLGTILTPLIHCRALRCLTIVTAGIELRSQDATMLARIPVLEELHCYRLCIGSLEPLADAPALREIEFEACTGLLRVPINIREMIPSMPLVSKLTIHEADSNQLSEFEAEQFNVALRQRLPSLMPAYFTQLNLRPSPDSLD